MVTLAYAVRVRRVAQHSRHFIGVCWVDIVVDAVPRQLHLRTGSGYSERGMSAE